MFFKKKTAQKDFDPSQLPSNRWATFLDVLRYKKGLLFNIGLILFLFALPLVIISHLQNVTLYEINLLFTSDLLTFDEASNQIFEITIFYNFLFILALIFFALGLSGVIRILRNMIWQDSVFIWYDFKRGVKDNYKHITLIFLLIGGLNFIMQYIIRYGFFVEDSTELTIAISLSIAALVITILVSIFFIFQTAIYNLSVFSKFKNAFLFFFRYAFSTILLVITLIIPWLTLLIPIDYLYLLFTLILFIIVLPIELVAITAYCFHIFDKTINYKHHTEIYKKGLWPND